MPDWVGDDEQEGVHLYMLEVVVDSVAVRDARAGASVADSILPALARVRFLDLPVLEMDKNKLVFVEDNLSGRTGLAPERCIRGLPEDWRLRDLGDRLQVEVPYTDRDTGGGCTLEVTVPAGLLDAGEALTYLMTALRDRLSPENYQQLQERVTNQLAREKDKRPPVKFHKFSTGKSCLFHMAPSEIVTNLVESPICLQIFQSGTEGNEFVHTLVGEAKIPLDLSFTKAILLACAPSAVHPTSAHLDSILPMYDSLEYETGEVHVFVRLSCFGPAPFQNEETQQSRKNRILRDLLKREEVYAGPRRIDVRYPWRKNLEAVPERPAPKPRLQPDFDLNPPPTPPLPPFDFGKFLPNIPRCTPMSGTPCYRSAGDPPLSRCPKEMERQLLRESLTKGGQTEGNFQEIITGMPGYDGGYYTDVPNQGLVTSQPNQDGCTCPPIPPELRPQEQTEKDPKRQCTCAAIMKAIVAPQSGQPVEPPLVQPPQQKPQKKDPLPAPQPLGDSDYEITLTKAECGLERKQSEKIEDKKVAEKPGEKNDKAPKPDPRKTTQRPKEKKVDPSSRTIISDNAAKSREATKNHANEDITQQGKPKAVESSDQRVPTANFHIDIPDEIIEETESAGKPKNIYEPTPGMYPGHQYGHRKCVTKPKMVPKNMGWLWTSVTFDGHGKGGVWYPGTIRGDVNKIMNKIKEDKVFSDTNNKVSNKPQRKILRHPKSRQQSRAAEDIKHNPNLHIHKKQGYYYVTMLPVKTDSQEYAGIEPAPIEYKIDPKHPDGSGGESYDSDTSSSSNPKSYEMNFIVPLALRNKKRKFEKATKEAQYNELDLMKKGQKKHPPSLKPPVEDSKHQPDAKHQPDLANSKKDGKKSATKNDAKGKEEPKSKEAGKGKDVKGKDVKGKVESKGKAAEKGKEDTKRKEEAKGKNDVKGKEEPKGKQEPKGKEESQAKEDPKDKEEQKQKEESQYIIVIRGKDGKEEVKGIGDAKGREVVKGKGEVKGKDEVKGKGEVKGKDEVKGKGEVKGKDEVKGKGEVKGKDEVKGKEEPKATLGMRGKEEPKTTLGMRGKEEQKGKADINSKEEVKGNADGKNYSIQISKRYSHYDSKGKEIVTEDIKTKGKYSNNLKNK